VGNALNHESLVARNKRTASRRTWEAVATYLQQAEEAAA
jgi:hypothetical protein